MAKKLYVGNIPFSTTEDQLNELFGQYGEIVSVTIVKDRDTGRSRGFGFVEMENADEAAANLNDKEFGGRNLRVNEARERESRPRRFGGGGGGRGGYGGGGRRQQW